MNRADRRKREREIKKMIKAGVGVKVTLSGYRVVRSDGTVKYAAGMQPSEKSEGAA